jgi:hypothetical protein
MSTARKIPSMCARNLKKPTIYSTVLFLFNGVPSGAFLAQGILQVSGYPVTGCVHDLVFEIGNLKKMGNARGLILSRPGRRLHLPRREISPNRAPFPVKKILMIRVNRVTRACCPPKEKNPGFSSGLAKYVYYSR